MDTGLSVLTNIHPVILLLFGVVLVSLVWLLSSLVLTQRKRGLSLAQAKEEMEVRKAFF